MIKVPFMLCRDFLIVMLNVIMLSVVMLNVVAQRKAQYLTGVNHTVVWAKY